MTYMSPQPGAQISPPAVPPSVKRGWWRRNWVWMLIVGIVLVIAMFFAGIGGLVVLAMRMMKRAEAYQLAIQEVRKDRTVIERLGEPIAEGWYVAGNINVSGSEGFASLSFPISGPKGTATVYAEATRTASKWSIVQLMVEIDQTGEQLILIDNSQLAKAQRAPPVIFEQSTDVSQGLAQHIQDVDLQGVVLEGER
ncbi:MAG: cytochrome c oxidase assembly factor Coa1 family protein [Planctomycetota bacterium]|jgi:hypothetical protein